MAVWWAMWPCLSAVALPEYGGEWGMPQLVSLPPYWATRGHTPDAPVAAAGGSSGTAVPPNLPLPPPQRSREGNGLLSLSLHSCSAGVTWAEGKGLFHCSASWAIGRWAEAECPFPSLVRRVGRREEECPFPSLQQGKGHFSLLGVAVKSRKL